MKNTKADRRRRAAAAAAGGRSNATPAAPPGDLEVLALATDLAEAVAGRAEAAGHRLLC